MWEKFIVALQETFVKDLPLWIGIFVGAPILFCIFVSFAKSINKI